MMSETIDVTQTIDELRAQVAELTARLARLEAQVSPPRPDPVPQPAAPPRPVAAPAPQPSPTEPISEEILLVISAAVAAFLGDRAHIRSVRLISSRAWAQEGRVSIQASHRLH
ncbi:MAG: hypothetical protein SFV54_25390 [Bryobacteraceae bacterium]|nr:hypothetical protein [Bryobacteraceae bacterium]